MKKIMLTVVALFFVTITFAQQDIASAQPGTQYGEGVAAGKSVSTVNLKKHLEKNESFEGQIQGKVIEVCKAKGCYMRIDNGSDKPIMVRFKDYGFFMPQDMVGKTVLLDGSAAIKTVSVEAQKQHAEDDGKSAEDIAKITEPNITTEVLAKGVRVIK